MRPALFHILNSYPRDEDAEALFARMSVKPTIGQKRAYAELIIELKRIGIWDVRDAIYCFASHDPQAALLDIKGAHDAALNGAPLWGFGRGFTGGAAGYVDAGFAPSGATLWTQNDAHACVYELAEVNTGTYSLGCVAATTVRVSGRNAGNAYGRANSAEVLGATASAIGLTAVNRTASDALAIWQNGAELGTDTDTTSAPSASNFSWLYSNGTAATNRVVAYGGIGSQVTLAQHALEHIAVKKYLAFWGAA